MPPDNTCNNVTYVKPNSDWEGDEVSLDRNVIWNDERLPNTHGSRLKILRWTMKEWSKKQNPPMDSIEGRGFMNDEDWVIHMIDEFIPDNGKNSMSDKDKRRANFMFKKYGGTRNGLDFTKVGKVFTK